MAFPANIILSSLDGTTGFTLTNRTPDQARTGFSVASAGDVNGDGFDDLIIGNPVTLVGGVVEFSGTSYVVFGTASGFAAAIDISSLTTPTTTTTSTGSTPRRLSTPSRLFGQSCDP